MADDPATEFMRFVDQQRRAKKLPPFQAPRDEGEVVEPVLVDNEHASQLMRVAALRAAGFFRPTRRTEVVWVQGESELAVNLASLDVKFSPGLIRVLIPVRSDQTGEALSEVVFAVGAPDEPAGLYASTYRRPNGPALIVGAWGESLVAFGWQCVLGLVTEIARAVGKDQRGHYLVPVEMTASARGIEIVPMTRHRFTRPRGPVITTKRRGER